MRTSRDISIEKFPSAHAQFDRVLQVEFALNDMI